MRQFFEGVVGLMARHVRNGGQPHSGEVRTTRATALWPHGR